MPRRLARAYAAGFLGAFPITHAPDLSLTSWAIDLPHVIIAGIALVVGFRGCAASRARLA